MQTGGSTEFGKEASRAYKAAHRAHGFFSPYFAEQTRVTEGLQILDAGQRSTSTGGRQRVVTMRGVCDLHAREPSGWRSARSPSVRWDPGYAQRM